MSKLFNTLRDVLTPYAEKIKSNKTEIDVANNSLGRYLFGENFINITAVNKTHNGINFVVNGESITANGTATSNAFIDVCHFSVKKTGSYRLYGAPAGGGVGTKFTLFISGTNIYEVGNGASYTLIANTDYLMRIIIYKDFVANNLTFTPRLTYNESTDQLNGVGSKTDITDIELRYGAWQPSGFEPSGSRKRICTNLIKASGTFTISLDDFSNYRFAVIQYPIDSSHNHIDSGWKSAPFTVEVDFGHYFALTLSKKDDTVIDDLSVFKPSIKSAGFHWHVATVDDISEADKRYKFQELSQFYYDHSFILDLDASTEDIIIPSESLANIDTSYRLGFHVIEANVKTLQDGSYIVCHGGGTSAKYFGGEFEHVNGTTDISETAFADVDLAWVRNYVRYRSSKAKYRTYPPTLQEFLYACKSLGMTALIQCVSAEVASIADDILGKNNWIGYGANRNMTKGLIMSVYSPSSIEDALSKCYEYGRPYMLCLGNTTEFTSENLKKLISAVHQHGYLIGYVQYFVNNARYDQEYKDLGFDFCASTWAVNNFEDGNICNLTGDIDFSDFTVSGGNVLSENIELTETGSIIPAAPLDPVFLGKGKLNVAFEGQIRVIMGKHIDSVFDSITTPNLVISTFFLNEVPTFTISGYSSNSVIKKIIYKASKC